LDKGFSATVSGLPKHQALGIAADCAHVHHFNQTVAEFLGGCWSGSLLFLDDSHDLQIARRASTGGRASTRG
jgi:hypothetical protein